MKKIVTLSIIILCYCNSQVRDNKLEKLEIELCEIDSILNATRFHNPYDFVEQEEKYHAFEEYRDSLQILFFTKLEEICRTDSLMKYDFKVLDRCMTITQSGDNRIRLFTRDTYLGGTMPYLCTYVQYITDGLSHFNYFSDVHADDKSKFGESNDSGLYYDSIYIFNNGIKIYYLISGKSQIASFTPVFGLKAISLSDNKIEKEDIFLEDDELSNTLVIAYKAMNLPEYNSQMYIRSDIFPRIIFDSSENTILIPDTHYDEEMYYEELTGEVKILKYYNGLFQVIPKTSL